MTRKHFAFCAKSYIRDETEEVLRLMEKPRMDRKAIRETLNLIVKMIGREK